MPICGFLIASIGWESVFYVTGGISLIWSVAWFFVVFDSPAQHPRISVEERQYIEESIGTTSTKKVIELGFRYCVFKYSMIFNKLIVFFTTFNHSSGTRIISA